MGLWKELNRGADRLEAQKRREAAADERYEKEKRARKLRRMSKAERAEYIRQEDNSAEAWDRFKGWFLAFVFSPFLSGMVAGLTGLHAVLPLWLIAALGAVTIAAIGIHRVRSVYSNQTN